jgi:hypothetical protein
MKITGFLTSFLNYLWAWGMFFILFTGCLPISKQGLLSPADDLNFGKIIRDNIAAQPQQFRLLAEVQYPQFYLKLRQIRDQMLTNPNNVLNYAQRFDWDIRLIQNDQMVGAFVTPGGYMYCYTGLLKQLQTEDELAALIALLIVQADQRWVMQSFVERYGLTLIEQFSRRKVENDNLLQVFTNQLSLQVIIPLRMNPGRQTQLVQLTTNLLVNSSYACSSLKTLLQNPAIAQSNWRNVLALTDEVIQAIDNRVITLGCSTVLSNQNYTQLKNTLP